MAVVFLIAFGLSLTAVAIASHEPVPGVIDNFEDGDTDGWDMSDAVSCNLDATQEHAFEGDYSGHYYCGDIGSRGEPNHPIPADSYSSLSGALYVDSMDEEWVGYEIISNNDEVGSIQFHSDGNIMVDGTAIASYEEDKWYRARFVNINYTSNTFDVIIEDGDGEVSRQNGISFLSPTGSIDEFQFANYLDSYPQVYIDYLTYNDPIQPAGDVEGVVTDTSGNELENVTVTAWQNETIADTTTDEFGQYGLTLPNGTFDLTASKDGYFNDTATVTMEDGDVTQDFQLRNQSAALSINTRAFLEHGLSAPYSVTYESTNEVSGRLTREDVTDNSTVTSGDVSVVTVDQEEQEVVATDDTSVNNQTYIQAEWTDPSDGETYTAQRNVTVANATVDNLGILPPVHRFTASLSGGTDANPNDKTIMLLIIGTAAAAAASRIATSFAGIAALCMVMQMGWIMGMTSDGMAMVTVFIALFCGLNTAGNVDYTVQR